MSDPEKQSEPGQWNVYVTRKIPQEGLDVFQEAPPGSQTAGKAAPGGQGEGRPAFNVQVNPHDRVLSRQELLAAVRGAHGLITMLNENIDAEVMDAAGPQLRVIGNYAVGFNNIDLAAATQRGIVVCNTPGVLTETTADLAWALLMASARRVVEGDHMVRAGQFQGWAPMLLLGQDVYGKTLGIVGFGRIGQAVARRARGFDMRVVYYSAHRRPPEEEQALGATYLPLDELLRQADFVSLHVNLTPATRHLIDERALSLMKPTAHLINTARGPVVDEAALVRALREGRIAGAGLDVFENEPALAPGLKDLPNVTLLPHAGSASIPTRTRMAVMIAQDVRAVLQGQRPAHPVNTEVLEAR
ncbi:MAG: D-glycerate dehydrogenase [Firmicutes bacterium]|nr:D-glycerate dehydrogenase [Bacillota bacterium]